MTFDSHRIAKIIDSRVDRELRSCRCGYSYWNHLCVYSPPRGRTIGYSFARSSIDLFRYVGQVVGVALSSALLQSILNTQLHQRITGSGAEEVRSVHAFWHQLVFSVNGVAGLGYWLNLTCQIIEQIRKTTSIISELSPDLRRAAIDSYIVGLRGVVRLFNPYCWSLLRLIVYPDSSY